MDRDAPIETIAFARPAWLPGVEIMTVVDSRRLYRGYHEAYAICTLFDTDRGGPEWVYRGRLHQSPERSLMVMEPGEAHATKRIFGLAKRFAVLTVPAEAVEDLAVGIGMGRGGTHLARASVEDEDLFGVFAAFHASFRVATTALEQQSRLVECLRRLLERCGESRPAHTIGRNPSAVARARDCIHDAYREEIVLDDLAAEAGVSPYHLCRLFSNAVGLPPHAYQLQVRLARARQLLAGGTPQSAVAVETGFYDQSHLGRCFKGAFGVTPGRYATMTSSTSN